MDDSISRQAAIDTLFELYEYQRDIDPTEGADLVRQGVLLAEKRIEKLPSAQPEPKIGKWIKMSDADGTYYCCSECGEELYRVWTFDPQFDLFPRRTSIEKTKYCPECGAKMEGETVVEDVKGVRTDAYRIKRKLMLERYNIQIKEV